MNQAIKTALEKYSGKQPTQNNLANGSKSNKIITVVATVILVLISIVLIIRFNVFGAGKIWTTLSEIEIGGSTVGEIIDKTKNDIVSVFSSKDEDVPLNPTGESGEIQTESVLYAKSLNQYYVK